MICSIKDCPATAEHEWESTSQEKTVLCLSHSLSLRNALLVHGRRVPTMPDGFDLSDAILSTTPLRQVHFSDTMAKIIQQRDQLSAENVELRMRLAQISELSSWSPVIDITTRINIHLCALLAEGCSLLADHVGTCIPRQRLG